MVKKKKKHGENSFKFSPVLPARIFFLAIFSLIVFVAGLMFPARAQLFVVIDGLWILCLCLTAAVFMLSIMAKNISELSGLASMLIYTYLLKFAAAVISAKALMTKHAAGNLIEKIGFLLNPADTSLTAAIILISVSVSLIVVFLATSAAVKQGAKYSADAKPFEYVSIEADLNAGIISESQAAAVKNKIAKDGRFYLSMSSAAKFIRFDSIFGILVIVSILTGTITSMSGTATTDKAALEAGLALMIGVSVLIYLPAVLLAISASAAVSKPQLHEPRFNSYQQQTPPSADPDSKSAELLNPDFIDIAATAETPIKPASLPQPVPENTKEDEKQTGNDQPQKKAKVILLASRSVEHLPVTNAVDLSVKIADSNKRCLLIDAHTERNAVYKVFEIDEASTGTPVKTCIDNLLVWKCDPAADSVGVDLARKIANNAADYDCIIIYAPKVSDGQYYGKLAGLTDFAEFTADPQEDDYIIQLKQLLEAADCKCIVNPPKPGKDQNPKQ